MTDQPTNPQASLFEDETIFFEDDFPIEAFLEDEDGFLDLFSGPGLDYEDVPLLVLDTDPDRAIERQKELMDTVFGGIGEERKEEKRMGLALQEIDVEQRHALRLLLIYQDPLELARHLNRCLADPAYGYGERGDQGRTIAQAMAAIGDSDDVTDIAAAWLASHRDFQQSVLAGRSFSFLSLFDIGDLDTFVPLVQRIGDGDWRLGVEGEGKHRDFHGPMTTVWPRLADTYVQWCDADNEQWLQSLKNKAKRQTPDSIFRAARAERLRKERDTITVSGNEVVLSTTTDGEGWPRTITMTDTAGTPLLGLSRLSGHNFYELSWNGRLNVRLFEISSTSRNKVPVEHIELALLLAETLAAEQNLQPEPVTANDVEAAYLRRMKAKRAVLAQPTLTAAQLPLTIKGQPAAAYTVGQVTATLLADGDDGLAFVTRADNEAQSLLLRRDLKRGLLLALPVQRGCPQRGNALMSTSLAELDLTDPDVIRAVLAWGCWLLWATTGK